MAELPGFSRPRSRGTAAPSARSASANAGCWCCSAAPTCTRATASGPVAHGVRTAAAAGCRTVVLTNAAGGIREGMRVGEPVLIADHLNLTATSPLVGAAASSTSPTSTRPALRARAREIDPTLAEGVYAGLPGPHYETPAEIRMLRALGADLVGMSTVLEAIAARAAGPRGVRALAGHQPRRRASPASRSTTRRCWPRAPLRRAGWAALLRELVMLTPAAPRRGHPWIADDPDPATRDELTRVLAGAMAGTPGAADELADRLAGPLRSARPGCAGRCGPGRPDERGRGAPRDRRARRLAGPGRAGARSWSAATPGTAPSLRRGRRRGVRRRRVPRARAPRPAADPGARVRRAPPRRRRGRADHRVPQPAADNGYKVYLADGAQIAPPPTGDRGGDHGRAARPLGADRGAGGRHGCRRAYLDRVARLPRGAARDLRIALTPMHGVGGATPCTPCARRVHRRARRRGAGRARPGVPDGGVPEPGGARRHRPAAGAGRRRRRRPRARARPRRRPVRAGRCPTAGDAHRRRDRRAARRPPPAQRRRTPTRWSRPPSSRPRCCARSPRRTGPATPRRSPGSSGSSAAAPGWCTATRRRWATASTPTRPRQGRHRGGRARLRPRRRAEGRRLRPARPARRAGPRTASTRRRGSRCAWCPPPATPSSSACAPPRPRAGRPTARRRTCWCCAAAANARRPAVGHGAEAEGVPGGGRAARRRRRRGPCRRRAWPPCATRWRLWPGS